MDVFTTHTGIPVPLRRSNVDTDQIIPAVWLKKITRTGFQDGLFGAWRTDPDFVLNQPAYARGTILIAGPDFGTGSSREHAVWALQNYGFKVVIGTRFGDIFRGNASKSGLLIATVSPDDAEALWGYAEQHPGEPISIDLTTKSINAGAECFNFEIDDHTRERLLGGWDDISITLSHVDQIADFETRRLSFKPTTTPLVNA